MINSLTVARLILAARANPQFHQELVDAPAAFASSREIDPVVVAAAAHTLRQAIGTKNGVWW